MLIHGAHVEIKVAPDVFISVFPFHHGFATRQLPQDALNSNKTLTFSKVNT